MKVSYNDIEANKQHTSHNISMAVSYISLLFSMNQIQLTFFFATVSSEVFISVFNAKFKVQFSYTKSGTQYSK